MDFSFELLALFFLVAVCAGLLDTLAGGGGLITIPALVLAGAPPLAALGTNKLQGCVGTATASFLLFRRKKILWADLHRLILPAFLGAILGTVAIQFVNTSVLEFMIPCVLVIIALYFMLSPLLKLESTQARLSASLYQKAVMPLIGCYDGMFGPGTGSFFALVGVSLRGLALVTATAMAKPLNFVTNLASLAVFLLADQILWTLGVVMMFGQMIGAWVGSHALYKVNPAYLRVIIVLVCLLMLARYVYQTLL